MSARAKILLSICLLCFAVGAQAVDSEAAPLRGAVSFPDSCRIQTIADYLRTRAVRGSDLHRLPGPDAPHESSAPGLQSMPAIPPLAAYDALPQPVADPNVWGADGNVLSLARAGNTLYLAGAFRSVGENSGGLVAIDPSTGQRLMPFPKVAGSVGVIVPDSAGGWFIGGDFTAVAGQPRSCIAHINADGSVANWNPNVSGSPGYITLPVVTAIAVCGSHVFIGGAFRDIGGQPHENFGCVDLASGAVLDWNLDTNPFEQVSTFAAHGDTLFITGQFSEVGGQPRSSLAAINATTGAVLPWQVDLNGGAGALLASGDTLYVGGDFTSIGGWRYAKLAAVGISSAYPLPIDFRYDGVWVQYGPLLTVSALAKVADTLYVVGNFTKLGGQVRSSIAALDARTGDALAWSPDTLGPRLDGYPSPLCMSVAIGGSALYVGGFFNLVAGQYHPFIAAWDRHSGHVLDWNPTPDDVVTALTVRRDTVYAGGYFHMMGAWQHRAGLAAIDLNTGRLKSWNPNPNGSICTAIAVHEGKVLVSGDFSVIGGHPQSRSYFAALDTLDGGVADWDPGANDLATSFLLAADTLYVGGMFSTIGGQPRYGLAAVSATTGEVLPWDPNAGSPFDGYSLVYTMARESESIYLGGTFTEIGGQPRLGLASVDATTGTLNAWDPGTDNSTVKTLVAAGGTLYVGGGFHALGGQPRNAIGAVDAATGAVLPWYPPPTGWGAPSDVEALAVLDSLIYVGGSFETMNGQPRICLAAVDTATSLVTSWDPGLDGRVWALATGGNTLYVGGGFARAGGLPAANLAAFTMPTRPQLPPSTLRLAQCFPNPVRATAQIRFDLPAAGIVTLSVYDLQGRRVATPLNRSVLPAGDHRVEVSTQAWRPGMYLCRLEEAGRVASRKIVVVR